MNWTVLFYGILLGLSIEALPSKCNVKLDPCDDFYDYICEEQKSCSDWKIPVFNVTSLTEFFEVQQPNITFTNNGTYIPLNKLLNLKRLKKWTMELSVLDTDSSDIDLFEYEFYKNDEERFKMLLQILDGINSTTINKFYNALSANIDILKAVRPPVAQKNAFFKWLFDMMKNKAVEEIQKTNLPQSSKNNLIFDVKVTNSFYAFYDLNNISMIQDAKLAYEVEYYRLKSLISEEDQKSEITEKVVRVGAIDAAMKATNKYTGFYNSDFLFQAINGNPSDDAFQYANNIHITTITRNDPKFPQEAMADSVFVTTHEILHKIYPFGEHELGYNETVQAHICARLDIQNLAESDKMPPDEGWYNGDGNTEDIVNILALRVVMKMAAKKSKDQNELKETLRTLIRGLCKPKPRKNMLIPHHHPLELSLNLAIRQYPLFSTLFQCKPEDRMYSSLEKLCKPLGQQVNVEDYKLPKDSEDVGGFFNELVKKSKSMNFSYGSF